MSASVSPECQTSVSSNLVLEISIWCPVQQSSSVWITLFFSWVLCMVKGSAVKSLNLMGFVSFVGRGLYIGCDGPLA